MSKVRLKEGKNNKAKVDNEVFLLNMIDHPGIVKLYEIFETESHFLIIIELCPGGDMIGYVRRRKKLSEDLARHFFIQLVHTVKYLHHIDISHRDIKLDNLLLDAFGNLKLCDFGVSQKVDRDENGRAKLLTSKSGTPVYISPEMLTQHSYDGFKSDVWSCGVVLYSMLYGEVPFRDTTKEKLNQQILAGDYQLPDSISEDARDLIKGILTVDQKKRLTLDKILEHPWLQQTATSTISLFTPLEMETIKKVFDADLMGEESDPLSQDTRDFTEHQLDTTCNSDIRNVTTKSVVLAPYNSSKSNCVDNSFVSDHTIYNEKGKVMRFKGGKMKEMDREYEANNNANMDNGVYNTEDEKSRHTISQNPSIDHGQGGAKDTRERGGNDHVDGKYLR